MISAVALVLTILIASFNLVLRERLSRAADSALYARASAGLASLQVRGDRLLVHEAPDAAALDPGTWVFSATAVLERPRSDAATERVARSLAGGPRRTRNLAATHTRLYAVPVVTAGRRFGTVVAEVSLRPYESTTQTALVASVVLGLVVALVVTFASRFMISGALAPVADMTVQAAEWSETGKGLRFGLGPPRDELTHLAATLDALLDRVAASIRHEQRFSAELSHELRTPLAGLIAEAQLALRHGGSSEEYRAGYERVLAGAQQMSRTLEILLAAARAELPHSRRSGEARAAAQAAARGCAALAQERGVSITVSDPGAPVAIGVDASVAERVLAPLIENGCRHARSAVSVTIDEQRRTGSVAFVVGDDGPGVPASARERIFEPGWRGEGGDTGNRAGAGLGLPLARRLARAAGGEVELEGADGHGGQFNVRLPEG
ncbi:MAG: sensor histidine kinase [Solirubrobacteraceae bacterium]